MKIAIVYNHKDLISKEAKKLGFKIVKKNPQIVIAFGGEGTFLKSEEIFPNIPKLFLRHHPDCKICQKKEKHKMEKILSLLKKKKYKIIKKVKLQAKIRNKKIIVMNDVNIHYKLPCAIGLELKINGKSQGNALGDGLLISTPYGSTGYWKSITHKSFKKGIGIAFILPTIRQKKYILNENSKIKVLINKHKGVMTGDSIKKLIPFKNGDKIFIKKYGYTKLISINNKEKIHIGGRKN
ncbi:MAG: hypothetical protein ABIB46_00540 [bacterium]